MSLDIVLWEARLGRVKILMQNFIIINHLIIDQRELWREEAAIEQSLQNIREELSKTERNLKSTVSKVSILS